MKEWGTEWIRPTSIFMHDLDEDGRPEVMLWLWTGGAHCCSVNAIVGGRGGGVVRIWDNYAEGRLADLNRDGKWEFSAADGRFAYSALYPRVAFPIQIWAYRPGRLVDVTRRFPAAVSRDAHRFRTAFEGGGGPPALDAYVAETCLLGRFREAWAFAVRAGAGGQLGRRPRHYLRGLRRYLRSAGYCG